MFKYTDIRKAIAERINENIEDATYSIDIERKIERPSFFIDLDSIKASDFMNEARDTNMTCRIYYFPSTRDANSIEILEMQDKLESMFLDDNLIIVDDEMSFEIEELDFNVVDKVLHCYFNIKICQNYNRVDDRQNIGEVNIDITTN